MTERIINAQDYAKRDGCKSTREMIRRWSGKMYQRGMLDTPFKDGKPLGTPLMAEVNHGQWVAQCDQCNTWMPVDMDDPILFCYGCGNRHLGGSPRPVVFPAERAEIEALLLARPVDDRRGTNPIDRAFNALPLALGVVDEQMVSLDRTYKPGEESVEDLRKQNKLIGPLMEAREALGLRPFAGSAKQDHQDVLAALEQRKQARKEEAE